MTRALYRVVANAGTWGLAALQQMPTSGIDWENLTDIEKKIMANILAYLHYEVNTDEGRVMRKNNLPRSIANLLGELYNSSIGGEVFSQPADSVTEWLNDQGIQTWEAVRPVGSKLSGAEYKRVWEKLNGF